MTPLERKSLKARAHALDPVVMIGDRGLTPTVLAEIDRALAAHELIKVRVAGDDRDARLALRDRIVAELGAIGVQDIGKLVVLYRERPADPDPPRPARPARKTVAKKALQRRPGAPKPSTRKVIAADHPPRTDRIRKSGQRSTKKPHQSR